MLVSMQLKNNFEMIWWILPLKKKTTIQCQGPMCLVLSVLRGKLQGPEASHRSFKNALKIALGERKEKPFD